MLGAAAKAERVKVYQLCKSQRAPRVPRGHVTSRHKRPQDTQKEVLQRSMVIALPHTK
jgi:hypothetical protein